MSAERWLPIPGWEDRYEVSDRGRVRSAITGRLRALALRRDGYLFVPLWRDNRCTSYYVHRLVAAAFCEHPPGRDVVRHLDGDRLNNVPGNLAWGTNAENVQDTVRHGRHRGASKTHCVAGHEYTPQNTIRKATGRNCRTCTYESNARSKARARAAQPRGAA